jgi:hypothetical protein
MPNHSHTQLCPAQQRAFDALSAGVQVGSILRLRGGCGRGKTTILTELHNRVGGTFLNMKDFVEASARNHPLAIEETLYRLLLMPSARIPSSSWMTCISSTCSPEAAISIPAPATSIPS